MNRQYDEMLTAAVSRLKAVDITAACKRAGIDYSDGQIVLDSFGARIMLDTTTWMVEPPIDMWLHLPLLQYLEAVDDALPGDRWIGMAELVEGGLVRGASFDREVDSVLAQKFCDAEPGKIIMACEKLGGKIVPGRGDLSAIFHFAPHFPLLLNLWYADDEFPASGKVLINDAVKHHLGTEAIGTLVAFLIRMIGKELK